jgi:hypothetical protein
VRGIQHQQVQLPVEAQELQGIAGAPGAVETVGDRGEGAALVVGGA